MGAIQKRIDWTQLGGFPLCQDDIQWITDGLDDALTSMIQVLGPGTVPVVLTGMAVSGGGNTVASGFFYYLNQIVKFTGGTVTPGGGEVALVEITQTPSPLTFGDASTPNVVFDMTGALTHAATVTDSTHFPVSALISYGQALGEKYRESGWNVVVVSTLAGVGGVTGDFYYKKNFLTNTLQIRAFLTSNNAQNFAASPTSTFSLMGTLPPDYWPIHDTYFICNYFLATSIQDDSGVAWIKQVNAGINAAGQIIINWIKPDVAVSGYSLNINTIIPLD